MTNKIIITKEDRIKYSTDISKTNESLVLHIEQDKFMQINEPLDLPRIPTIYDIKVDGKLENNIELTITKLSEVYPKLNFDNLTPAEVVKIENDNSIYKNMSREEIWKAIKPFFNSVFNIELGDNLTKMTEIARRLDNNPDYIPTSEWLIFIADRILQSRKDLFTYNIFLNLKKFSRVDNPIETLLMLMEVQKSMFPKRTKKISETYFSKFTRLISSHAECMIKLKILNRSGEDFYGYKYPKLRDDLRVLKSISYGSYGDKPLSVKQQQLLINIIDEYKKTLDLLFQFNEEEKDLFNSELQRPVKDIKLASLEIYHTFDDSSVNGRNYNLKTQSQQMTSCEIINSIFLTDNYSKQLNNIYKNGISMQHLTDYIEEYFSFNEEQDRSIIKNKAIYNKTATQKVILNQFYNILEKYN